MNNLKRTHQRYYVPGYDGVLCVHIVTTTHVITGDICEFYDDAYTNRLRYALTIEEFEALKPILIDEDSPESSIYLKASKRTGVLRTKNENIKGFKKDKYFYLGLTVDIKSLIL